MNLLPEDTPLMFQWLPKKFGSSVPNNENYLYLQRLVNWAEKEPQRTIYLVVNGAGLKQGQVEDLRQKLHPRPNIKVIDFNRIDLGENDFSLSIRREEIKVSELFKDFVLDEKKNQIPQIPFGVILDLMRLIMLANIQKFTERKEMIYMDFDILPSEENIGEIKIPREILMADGTQNTKDFAGDVENSIIAISESSKYILQEMISNVCDELSHTDQTSNINEGLVFGCMKKIIGDKMLSECTGMSTEQLRALEKKDYWEFYALQNTYSNQLKKLYESYQFQKNGGKVKLTQDNSWKVDSLGVGPELPLDFNELPKQKISATIAPLKKYPSIVNIVNQSKKPIPPPKPPSLKPKYPPIVNIVNQSKKPIPPPKPPSLKPRK